MILGFQNNYGQSDESCILQTWVCPSSGCSIVVEDKPLSTVPSSLTSAQRHPEEYLTLFLMWAWI